MTGEPSVRSKVGAVARTVLVGGGGVLVVGSVAAFVIGLLSLGMDGPYTGTSLIVPAFLFGTLGLGAAALGSALPEEFEGFSVPSVEMTPNNRRHTVTGAILLLSPIGPAMVVTSLLRLEFFVMGAVTSAILSLPAGLLLLAVGVGPSLLEHTAVDSLDEIARGAPTVEIGAHGGDLARGTLGCLGAGALVLGGGSIHAASQMGPYTSDTGGGAMGAAIGTLFGEAFLAIGVGMLVLAVTIPGHRQLLLRGEPTAERQLVVWGGLLLTVGPIVGLLIIFLGGFVFVLALPALGLDLVLLGVLLRATTLGHRRVRGHRTEEPEGARP